MVAARLFGHRGGGRRGQAGLGALVRAVVAGAGAWAITMLLLAAPGGASIPAPPLYTGGPPSDAPVLFILCNWGGGFSYHPNSLAYYQNVWTNPTAGGWTSLADYWRQVSFGQTTISGSTVLNGPHSSGGWYSMLGGSSPTSLVSYAGFGGGGSPTRVDRILSCMDAASADLTPATLSSVQSIVTVTPYVQAKAPLAISNGATTIKLSSAAGWPVAPFDINFTPPGGGRNYTDVQVNSIDFATNTLHLASPWSLGSIAAGALITSVTSDDVGYVGPLTIGESGGVFNTTGSGTTYTFGIADLSAGDPTHSSITNGVGDSAHEVGHSFGYAHSRTMDTSVTDYYDCWDQMSYDTCGQTPPATEAAPSDSVVGMDAIDLENQGWVPAAAQYHDPGGQHTVRLHALSDPNALSGNGVPYLDAHIPAAVTIQDAAPSGNNPTVPPTCAGSGYHCDTSDYFTVEYRQGVSPGGNETWDFGAGNPGPNGGNGDVVLHLHTPVPNPAGGNSFLVNTDLNANTLVTLPLNGGLTTALGKSADDEFTDMATHTYVAVNVVQPSTWTAVVTMSNKKIANAMTWTGPTTVTYGATVDLSAQVTVAGSGAPVPNVPVLISAADGLGCNTTTALNGVGSCVVTMTQGAETGNPSFNADGEFLGDAAYGGIYMAPMTFNIKKAPLTVTAVNVSRPHGSANPSLTAKLSGFVLGQKLATSGVTGSASCTTTATTGSPAGTYPITCKVGTLSAANYSFAKFVKGTLTVT
jgi:hypothetical protein